MGFKRVAGKSASKVGNVHAVQATATNNTLPTREQLSKELSAKVTKQDVEISKLQATIVTKDALISKLQSDLKDAQAGARIVSAQLAESETQLERVKDTLKTCKSRVRALQTEASKDRAFHRCKPGTSEAKEARRKRFASLAESLEVLLHQEPMLLQSMLEDSGNTADDQLPVYIEALVAFLSRHRLAIRAAVTILDTQPVTKLTKYLEANDTLRELEHFYMSTTRV
ncbi:hypothetical protein CYMTET_8153 [Cymbomonas tetramitiformis]|uniref:Uncharacterized protein n=1 Tax=Cymbomonas tetramitiformis TaxID=36881 RepID=A0AAE0GU88_9CHLO|nr:hypothetical protein CYMTET_8153 [Cymbomonas tetramitiformis]